MPRGRARLVWLVQIVVAAVALWFAWRAIGAVWADLQAQPIRLTLRWTMIAASGLVVLATYALLIELWRLLLRRWGHDLGIVNATRIWFVSALGRWVPGRVWQVGAMAVLAARAGVSPVAATGSAIVNTVVNIAAGIVVGVATGTRLLEALVETLLDGRPGPTVDVGTIAAGLAAAGCIGLALLPWLLPRIGRLAARVSGRPVELPMIAAPVIWMITLGHVLSWVLYGAAFQWLAHGVLGPLPGATISYVAVFTVSYVLGYFAFIFPGGLGPRELALGAGLTTLGLASPAEAVVLAIASRLWLTVLEVAPGALFLAAGAWRPRTPINPPDGAS